MAKGGAQGPTKKLPVPFSIPPALVEHILLGPTNDRRVLQDSPILGDVWLAYASDPASVQDLLITPHKDQTAAAAAREISRRLKGSKRLKHVRNTKRPKIAHLQGIVAACLTFDEVLHVVVPMTQWWQERGPVRELSGMRRELYEPASLRRALVCTFSPTFFAQAQTNLSPMPDYCTTLHRYLALAGLVKWAGKLKAPRADVGRRPRPQEMQPEQILQIASSNLEDILDDLNKLYGDILAEQASHEEHGEQVTQDVQQVEETNRQVIGSTFIFQVSLNRRAAPALTISVPAVKGDAARTLFSVKCDKIVWAVLDSGIDGTHDAFKDETGKSRVRKTFDFTRIREIISTDTADINNNEWLDKLLSGVHLVKEDEIPDELLTEAQKTKRTEIRREVGRKWLMKIAKDAEQGRPVNWDNVEELISLTAPPSPPGSHGTHVAGIVGACSRANDKENASSRSYGNGMCPDIGLYDFRVLGGSLEDTEFALIAAMQYIRYINERHSYITIHGANLSLSIPHDVRNFACGRTPVCMECERLIDSGVVVVAAAGNRGYHNFETKDGTYQGYAAFSITDPGNTDGVITVGATHGFWPHTYGVSFFSSRGPTGDGRLKPDLVAPGERVQSTVPRNDWASESGTSMAAPHVSGAAAMLMARYTELIGQPRRIKRILCESATDLGRERSFQGYGMLDVLRAFQSI